MSYDIGVIGCGIVGSALVNGLREGNDIRIYDRYKSEVNIAGWNKETEPLEGVVKNSEYIFVCLPTPYEPIEKSNRDGSSVEYGKIDLSIIDENVKTICNSILSKEQLVVIRSTVVPGTTRGYTQQYPNINFVFNPEFLREVSYLEDFLNPDRIIVGADNDHLALKLIDFYKSKFPGIPYFKTDLTTAEIVKYMSNIMLASITIVGNEFYDLCNKLGINYDEVKKMVKADLRLTNAPLDVTSVRGFGGKCFPKDLVAIINKAEEFGVNVSVLKAVWEKNLEIRKVRDWHNIPWTRTKKD